MEWLVEDIGPVGNFDAVKMSGVNSFVIKKCGLGHNIGHSVGWVERSETQQLIGVGFRSSTQPTGNPYGLKYDQGQKCKISGWGGSGINCVGCSNGIPVYWIIYLNER